MNCGKSEKFGTQVPWDSTKSVMESDSLQMQPIPDTNQEKNHLLLNAIKTKFAANTSCTSFSPSKFTIPSLKSSTSNVVDSNLLNQKTIGEDSVAPSKLNQFILEQLKNGNTQNTGFTIPKLASIDKLSDSNCSLGCTELEEETVRTINNGFQQLQVNQDQETLSSATIDLTAALNSSTDSSKPTASSVLKRKNAYRNIDFDIPFIQCDLKETEDVILAKADEYCETDVSSFNHKDYIASPSKFGRITCLKYRCILQIPYVDHSFKPKHKITQFLFDTKSPDDIILDRLLHKRRH